MKVKSILKLMTVAVALGVVFGCGGSGGGESNKLYPQIRAVNASPDSGPVEFLLNDKNIATAIDYLGSSPDFAKYKSEDYDFVLQNVGGGEALDIFTFQPADTKSYIAFASGLKDFGTEFDKRVRISVFEVARNEPNGSKARVIPVNALVGGDGASNLAIDFQDGERPLFPVKNLDFNKAGSVEVDAGTYLYEVRPAGSELVYVQKSLTFESGKIYLAVISGQDGGVGAKEPKITLVELSVKPVE